MTHEFRINKMAKVFVLGIDGAPPQLVFDKWIDELPNLKKLMDNGAFGRIESTIPPSTCIAWNSFFSGRDASDFGVYSYTKRNDFSYSPSQLISSHDIKTDMVWDVLTETGKKSYVIGVPITYPVKAINGAMVTGFMTPEFNDKSVHPPELREEIKSLLAKDYMFDVSVGLASYKKIDLDVLLEKVYEMTRQQFMVLRHLIERGDWDFATLVLIGSDRLQHTLWAHIDETHRNYKESDHRNSLKDYFIYIDKELGKIIELLDDDTTVIVSSDHGMDKMNFRFNLNDWLIKEGYLVLKEPVDAPVRFSPDLIDWKKTRAYSSGAYFGRIQINLEGREPEGIVAAGDYDSLQQELAQKIMGIKGDQNQEMDNKVYLTRDIYSGKYAKYAPDMIVYLDNLLTGTSADIGNPSLYSTETQVGKDDAGHAPIGMFVISGANVSKSGDLGTVDIYDVAPTIFSILNVDIPNTLKGKKIA